MVIGRIARFFKTNTNANLKKIQSAEVLLLKHQKLIDDIYHHSHVPKKHFESLYLYAIKRLAIWSQDLPASQNHHHSSEGGFLLHTLEVVEIALKKRNTKMLPIGASVEKQNSKKDVWTFAIFTAALLHDIGKTISDVNIMLYDSKQKELGRWSPWFGRMNNVKSAMYYQYQYNMDRKYQQHSLLPLSFLREFISPTAIDWMQKDNDLFALLLMTLQGRKAEGAIIADIVQYADSESSAESLKKSNNIDTTSTSQNPQPKSLADKLLDTLRYLVLETDLKINAPGAVMFTTNTDVYFVSKVIMDKVRDTLDKDKQNGVPFDNSRLMDELLQFHIIVPNSKGKAIFSCEISGGGFKKPVNLTMLRMSIDKVYVDGKYPEQFIGEIKNNDNDAKEQNSQQESHTTEATLKDKDNATNTESNFNLPMPPGFTNKDTSDTTDTAQDEAATKPNDTKIKIKTSQADVLETELGKDFLLWLVSIVNDRKIEINSVIAKVHIVTYKGDKSLFLVSPKIFKEYNTDSWAQVQKQFGRLRVNLKTGSSENIWKVQIKTKRTNKKPSQIGGYLITDPKKHGFNALPDPNKHLDLIVTE